MTRGAWDYEQNFERCEWRHFLKMCVWPAFQHHFYPLLYEFCQKSDMCLSIRQEKRFGWFASIDWYLKLTQSYLCYSKHSSNNKDLTFLIMFDQQSQKVLHIDLLETYMLSRHMRAQYLSLEQYPFFFLLLDLFFLSTYSILLFHCFHFYLISNDRKLLVGYALY
jgi:hypothetical protein